MFGIFATNVQSHFCQSHGKTLQVSLSRVRVGTMAKRKATDEDCVSMEILPLVPVGAKPPTNKPYLQLCGPVPPELLDFETEHKTVCDGFTNDWYTGKPPLYDCQGMVNLRVPTFCRLGAIVEDEVGPFGLVNRGWIRRGVRGVWYSPDRVPERIRLDATGFTKLTGPQRPRNRILLVAPPFEGAGVIVVPAYQHAGYEGYTSIHGICSTIDYKALVGPNGETALRKQDAKDSETFHFEPGGKLKIAIMQNTLKHSCGIFLDEPSEERVYEQHRAFNRLRASHRKTPRAWTPEVTSHPNPYVAMAVYMLHGYYAHFWFGKCVSDIAGLAGNGKIKNLGKLRDVRTKDGLQLRSTKEYEQELHEGNVADPKPDFLIRSPTFRHTSSEIIDAMSPNQRKFFGNTLIPALYEVEAMGAKAFTDEAFDPSFDPWNQDPLEEDLDLSDSDTESDSGTESENSAESSAGSEGTTEEAAIELIESDSDDETALSEGTTEESAIELIESDSEDETPDSLHDGDEFDLSENETDHGSNERKLEYFVELVRGVRGDKTWIKEAYLWRCVCAGGVGFTAELCEQLVQKWMEMDVYESERRFGMCIMRSRGNLYFV